jgi:glucose/arabinose dehydrogenase
MCNKSNQATTSTAGILALLVVFGSTSLHAAITGLERVAPGLSAPMFATYAPGDSTRLFIGERSGAIRVLNLMSGQLESTPYLTIPGVLTDGEGGLLGMTFHPDYQTNGKFYINGTFANEVSSFNTEIRQYTVSSNPNVANATPTPILRFIQPQTNHNAGWIGFNPAVPAGRSQYLYIPTGDGGNGNDEGSGHTPGIGNAQDPTNLLGKILRIDVNGDDFPNDPNRNYKIPAGNPYIGQAGEDEIWALGLRNPFRGSFDRATGDLWLGDVGQGAREEIDKQTATAGGGANFGWRLREGNIETPDVGGPEPANYVPPVYDYERTGNFGGNTVIGGYVYRGPDPQLQGRYFFSDTSDKFWTFDPANPTTSITSIKSLLMPAVNAPSFPVSYGEDADGNLYIAFLGTSDVYRINTDFLLPGDFNRDRQVTAADIQPMLRALINLDEFQATNNLSDLSLLFIGDINRSGAVTNADIQPLLNLIAASDTLNAVPEPPAWLLAVTMLGVACWRQKAALRRNSYRTTAP